MTGALSGQAGEPQHDPAGSSATTDALHDPSREVLHPAPSTGDDPDASPVDPDNDMEAGDDQDQVPGPEPVDPEFTAPAVDPLTAVLQVADIAIPRLQAALRAVADDGSRTVAIAYLRELVALAEPILEQDEADFQARYGVAFPVGLRRARVSS